MPKKVLIALPPAMLADVDHIAFVEHRTRSDLIREALRRYLDIFRVKHTPEVTSIQGPGPITHEPSMPTPAAIASLTDNNGSPQ